MNNTLNYTVLLNSRVTAVIVYLNAFLWQLKLKSLSHICWSLFSHVVAFFLK